jgi:phytanoyl-CoA hydroxylase
MVSTACRDRFLSDGFVVVPGFLSRAAVDDLHINVERYVRDVVPALPLSDALYVDRSRPETLKQLHRMSVDPYFAGLRTDPHWLALAEELLVEPVRCHEPEWFNKPPGEEAPTPPHQDNYYFNLTPPHVLTIWVALEPVDAGNGCLRYLPGSHRAGLRPHGRSSVLGFSQGITDYGDADKAGEVTVQLQPGDAVVHHGMTVHRAEANRSRDRQRRAFAMVLEGVSCRRDEVAHARYLAALEQQRQSLAASG